MHWCFPSRSASLPLSTALLNTWGSTTCSCSGPSILLLFTGQYQTPSKQVGRLLRLRLAYISKYLLMYAVIFLLFPSTLEYDLGKPSARRLGERVKTPALQGVSVYIATNYWRHLRCRTRSLAPSRITHLVGRHLLPTAG
jgi:hypothetical protein